MYSLQTAAQEAIGELISVGQDYLKEIDELLQIAKNPEKLAGKKFEAMGPQDFQMLHTIMGEQRFNEWFVGKEYPRVRELEAS